MVTIPACNDCNAEKSKHDDYLRDMLVVDRNSEQSKAAQALLDKVQRASQRNQSIVMRGAKSEGELGRFTLKAVSILVRPFRFHSKESGSITSFR